MKASNTAIELIKHFETLYLHPELDPVVLRQKKIKIYNIGYSKIIQATELSKYENGITKEKAEEILRNDLVVFESHVNNLVKTPLTQNQFDALVTFEYNTGGLRFYDQRMKKLKDSALLLYINQGQMSLAAHEFLAWNHVGSKVIAGLTRRRKCEKFIFEGHSIDELKHLNFFIGQV